VINPSSMRVIVDSVVRFEQSGNWENVEAPVAIGPCFGSAVTVRSFAIDERP
jgi:hypothetical protein